MLVVGNEVFGIKRSNEDDWRMNASRGAICERYDATKSQIHLAKAAVEKTGALVAGVDLMQDSNGKDYLLEVNAVPGWQAVSNNHDEDIAAKIMDVVLA